MKKYRVTIHETTVWTVDVEAKNKTEAKRAVYHDDSGNVIWDCGDSKDKVVSVEEVE